MTTSRNCKNSTLAAFALALACNDAATGFTIEPQVARRTLMQSRCALPYYADVETDVASTTLGEAVAAEQPNPAPEKRKPNKKGGNKHEGGILSPVVLAAKKAVGDDTINSLRGKAISLHSNVIGQFVETAGSDFGQTTLRSLFQLSDKDGNGAIDEDELARALKALGFEFLSETQVNGIFARADADKNGAIELDEFLEAAPKTLRTNLIKLAKKNGAELGLLA